ncbi:MAG: sodium/proton-translocating pyrophosphatase, partial [Bacteroidia bacterium]
TAMGKKPVNSIIQQSATGHATNIIGGLAVGMKSTVMPILVLAAGIMASYACAGLYGVAIAAAGMMATTAMQLAIDAFGPIADNAGGIAEMSQLPPEVRERTDNLDAVGNTTAATGKGFAIASAALTSLALFAAFVGVSGIGAIDIFKAPVLAMLFVGAMIPFIFSALAIAAVGRAAMDMVNEVRRQFREIPGIMEYKAKPEYEKCVEISTKASIREMLMPGAIALLTPIIIGFGFKGVFDNASSAEMLGGLLAGVTVSGVLMGIFQNNAGGAWDNAKKSFEKGVVINGEKFFKKSEPHKASVTGDTVGDPFKDTSGPSMNILIKLMSIVSLVIAPYIVNPDSMHGGGATCDTEMADDCCKKEGDMKCDMEKCKTMTPEQVAAYCDSMGCSKEQKEKCLAMVGAGVLGADLKGLTGMFNFDKSHTYVDFGISHLLTTARGSFSLDSGSVNFTGDLATSSMYIRINTASIDSKDEGRDEHLRNADFFDATKYPAMTFVGKSIKLSTNPKYRYIAVGDLTVKDVTKSVEIPFNYVGAKENTYAKVNAHSFEGEFTINRTEFHVGESNPMVGDLAKLTFSVESYPAKK